MKLNKRITTCFLAVLMTFAIFANCVNNNKFIPISSIQDIPENNIIAEGTQLNEQVSNDSGNNSVAQTKADFTNNNENATSQESNTVVLQLNDINQLNELNITENIVGVYENLNAVTIEIPQGADPEKIIEKYQANPEVNQAYVDQVAKLFYTPTDPYFSDQWNLNRLNMQSAWDVTMGNSSVVVAIVDTGVSHIPDIDGFVNGVDTSGSTVHEDTYSGQYSSDGGNHGTAIASLIASNFNYTAIAGIAPNVSIMPVKVFANGAEEADSTNIAAGIRWAADHGADIINLSLGFNTGTVTMQNAVAYAIQKGIMVIAASGNDGYTNLVSYPAAYDGVIAVGSTGRNDVVSDFSNEGDALDLVAPGEDILMPNYSDRNAIYAWAGTSFSAPTVCAVAALIKSKYPTYSNNLVESILYAGADDIGQPGWDTSSGYGIINAAKALAVAGDTSLIDNNDNIATADTISANTAYNGNIFPYNDKDYYKISVTTTEWVNITVSPTGLNDLILELYNQSAGLITKVDENAGGENEALRYHLNAGTYYIKVYNYDDFVYANDYSIIVNSDSTPPQIQYSNLSFDTAAYKVSVPVTDDISGIKNVYITYKSPISGTLTTYPLIFNSSTGKYEYTMQITSDTELGLWKIYSISAGDNESNNSIVYNSNIAGTLIPKADLSAGDMPVSKAVTGVVLDKSTIILTQLGDTQQLTATVTPSYAINKNVIWSSSNENVAIVDNMGLVTAVGSGAAIVTVTTLDGQKFATCNINVVISVTGVSLNKSSIIINEIGTTEQLIATVTPSNATNKNMNWTSSNENVAIVDNEGLVTSVGGGTATITVTTSDGDKIATCNVSVVISVTGIMLDKSSTIIKGIGTTEQITATITPSFATNKNVIWSSSNENIAIVNSTGLVTAVGVGVATITVKTLDGDKIASCNVIVEFYPVSVNYRTHVQNIGWQSYVSNGNLSGTTGQSLRLEAININVTNDSNLGISYSTHVQDIGWQGFVSDNALSGTQGQSKRLEAIKIKLTGADADLYDVYYCVHAESYGWLSWAKNGSAAGTEGLGLRLEAIKIRVVKKTDNVSFDTSNPFVSAYGSGLINYRTHVQNFGWQNYIGDGAMSGTSGQSLRLEGINIRLNTNLPSGSVLYSTHVQDIGWMNEVSDGALSGTQGQSKRLEAITIRLTGDVANQYDIYYRVHAQNVGWMGWAKNGERAGTAGFSYRLEGIQIVLVPKGGAAPGSTANAFIQA